MPPCKIEATRSTPLIDYDPERGLLRLEGESYPENALEFFAPLFRGLKDSQPGEGARLRVIIRLVYFNSSSSKCLLDLIDLLNKRAHCGEDIQLEWHYEEDDEDMLEAGQEFAEDAAFVFKLVAREAGQGEHESQ